MGWESGEGNVDSEDKPFVVKPRLDSLAIEAVSGIHSFNPVVIEHNGSKLPAEHGLANLISVHIIISY